MTDWYFSYIGNALPFERNSCHWMDCGEARSAKQWDSPLVINTWTTACRVLCFPQPWQYVGLKHAIINCFLNIMLSQQNKKCKSKSYLCCISKCMLIFSLPLLWIIKNILLNETLSIMFTNRPILIIRFWSLTYARVTIWGTKGN